MNEQKKKIPWWVALLQLLPAVIDSVSKLVKEAKAKKKLKRKNEAPVIARNEAISPTETEIASPQEAVRNDEYPETGPETYNKN